MKFSAIVLFTSLASANPFQVTSKLPVALLAGSAPVTAAGLFRRPAYLSQQMSSSSPPVPGSSLSQGEPALTTGLAKIDTDRIFKEVEAIIGDEIKPHMLSNISL